MLMLRNGLWDAPGWRGGTAAVILALACAPAGLKAQDDLSFVLADGNAIEREVVLAEGQSVAMRITARQSSVVQVSFDAADPASGFDPLIRLWQGDRELVTADDTQFSRDALLAYALGDGGEYRLVFSEYGGRAGQGRVQIRLIPAYMEPISLPLDGQPVSGMLGEDSPRVLEQNDRYLTRYQTFAFPDGAFNVDRMLADGQVLEIAMDSTAMDARLEVGFDTSFGFAVVDANDDYGCQTNSLIVIDPRQSLRAGGAQALGQWLNRLSVRTGSFADTEGAYTVSARIVERANVTPPPACEAPPEDAVDDDAAWDDLRQRMRRQGNSALPAEMLAE